MLGVTPGVVAGPWRRPMSAGCDGECAAAGYLFWTRAPWLRLCRSFSKHGGYRRIERQINRSSLRKYARPPETTGAVQQGNPNCGTCHRANNFD